MNISGKHQYLYHVTGQRPKGMQESEQEGAGCALDILVKTRDVANMVRDAHPCCRD